ncbi:MAG: hypothetical protein AB4911_00670 [Oscillochloridaceae bacterium umkhey_bin13]
MTDRTSSLNQRVRRLLGTGALGPPPPPPDANGHLPHDTGQLFESQLARLSHALQDLRAIDQKREAEMRELRAHLHNADARTAQALAAIDALLAAVEPATAPVQALPGATPFERMRARSLGQSLDPAQREAMAVWVIALRRIREELCSEGA